MNSLVFYSLILLSLARLAGFLVALSFFLELKKPRYGYMTFGWFLLILSSISPIIANAMILFELKIIFLILNVLLDVLGFYFSLIGLITEFFSFSRKTIFFYPISIIFVTIIASIVDYNLSIGINLFLFISSMVVIFGIPLIKKDLAKECLKESLRWYYLVLLVTVITFLVVVFSSSIGEGYGLFESNNGILIILNYSPSILAHIIIVIFIIQLENSLIRRDKNELKDKYSHDLGNMAQVVYGNTTLLLMEKNLPESTMKKLETIKKRCIEASDIIREIRKL